MNINAPTSTAVVEAAIADLITRAKGLDAIFDALAVVDGIVDTIVARVTAAVATAAALSTHDTALGVVDANVDTLVARVTAAVATAAALSTHDTALGVVDGMVDSLEAERLQRVTGKVARASTTSSSLADVVNVSDKGVLTGIYQFVRGDNQGFWKLTIDGTVVVDDSENFVYGNTKHGGLSFNHRFDTSLRVEHKNQDGSTTLITYVAYTTD